MSAQDTMIDTSTDEDASATDFENDDDNASWDEGEQVADKETESEDDSKANESDKEAEPESEDDDTSEGSKTTEEEKTEGGDEELEDTGDDAKKTETDLEAEHKRQMYEARQAERKAKDEAVAARKQAEDVSIEHYLAEAGDDEMERQRREVAVEAYHVKEEKIAINHDRLQAGIERAVATIPLFQTKDTAVQEELASSLDAFEAIYVVKDKNGRPVEIKTDPKTGKPADVYAYLQAKADTIKRLTGLGAKQQEKQKSGEKVRTMTTPVKAPKKAKADPDMEGFDEEAGRW